MGFYDSEEGCDQYTEMAAGYDGRALIERLGSWVGEGSRVLELGMGPGVDLDILRETFAAVGSDASPVFLHRYRERHPRADVRLVDAVTLEGALVEGEAPFDAIYSNKVLQHLTREQLRDSLVAQSAAVAAGGGLLHALWYGEEVEEHAGLLFTQHTPGSIAALLPAELALIDSGRYTELEEGDSLWVWMRRR